MSDEFERDPERDALLARVLRDAGPAALLSAEARARLEHAVRERAAFELARRRREAAWWNHAARWARPLVPAAAAGILLAVAINLIPRETAPTTERLTLEDPLESVVASNELSRIADAEDTDALLRMSLGLEE